MADDRFCAPEDSGEYNELFAAAYQGDTARLEAALLPSIDINALQADPAQGSAALHIAARNGNLAALRLLLAHGAQVDLRNAEWATPLHEAASNAQLDAIKILLKAGADITLEAGEEEFTMLDLVLNRQGPITAPKIKTIEFLLDQGCDPNRDDGYGRGSTMMSVAASRGCTELAQLFLDRGTRIGPALSSASRDVAMTGWLLDRGAKIVSPPYPGSAIVTAAGRGNPEVVRLLLSHATDADLASSREAMHWAAASGRVEVVKLLIEHGFDINETVENCFIEA
ncbi:MAG: hypothetical protein Q9223_002255 [Gallowayella weberi]